MLWFELSKQVRKTWKSPDIYVNFLFVPWFMHVYSFEVLTLFYEHLLRKTNIDFRILLDFFFRGDKSKPFINPTSLFKSVKNIRIL